MIYLKLRGRIGNQLFEYAAARAYQKLCRPDDRIVIEDAENVPLQYENSLQYYPIEGVEYIHDLHILKSPKWFLKRMTLHKIFSDEAGMTPRQVFDYEKENQEKWQRRGIFRVQDGLLPLPEKMKGDVMLDGYFQSEKFFEPVRDEIRELFSLDDAVAASGYPNLDKIMGRNTVCISIKVQHNVGNEMYDVCNMGYYEKAIKYMQEHVENPLFFICSDNVDYVKEHLIDTTKYDCVAQSRDFPVHISLAVMAKSKHFIIGNTSFGWWAQYLSDAPGKIVIAPSRWYGIDVPCEIYQDNWTLLEV